MRTPDAGLPAGRARRRGLHVADGIAIPGRQREAVQDVLPRNSNAARTLPFKACSPRSTDARRKERLQYRRDGLPAGAERQAHRAAGCAICNCCAGWALPATAPPIPTPCSSWAPSAKTDQRTVRDATEFLLRLRNELHFHAGKSNDVLDRAEQLRLAELVRPSGHRGHAAGRAVHARVLSPHPRVRSVVGNFVANCRPGSAWRDVWPARSSATRSKATIASRPTQIAATRRGLAKLKTDLSEVLRLCDLANCTTSGSPRPRGRPCAPPPATLNGEVNAETSKQFLALISQPGRLGELLRRLHELGVLEKIIPAFRPRPLPAAIQRVSQVHGRRALHPGGRAGHRVHVRSGPAGPRLSGHQAQADLHLALLIHDLGKGFVEDHSDVGLRIAERHGPAAAAAAARSRNARSFWSTSTCVMSHLAFRRDTSDDQLVVRFAVEVGSPEVLDMLYVLTAADFAAVGPGVWNSWKAEVLTDLYHRTMQHLAGDAPAANRPSDSNAGAPRCANASPASEMRQNWFARQIDALPHAYAFSSPPERIAAELRDWHSLGPADVHASGRYLPESHTVEFVVGTHETGHARRVPQADRRAGQPGTADSFGRDQHAGRRPGARPFLRARSRLCRASRRRNGSTKSTRALVAGAANAPRVDARLSPGLAQRASRDRGRVQSACPRGC